MTKKNVTVKTGNNTSDIKLKKYSLLDFAKEFLGYSNPEDTKTDYKTPEVKP